MTLNASSTSRVNHVEPHEAVLDRFCSRLLDPGSHFGEELITHPQHPAKRRHHPNAQGRPVRPLLDPWGDDDLHPARLACPGPRAASTRGGKRGADGVVTSFASLQPQRSRRGREPTIAASDPPPDGRSRSARPLGDKRARSSAQRCLPPPTARSGSSRVSMFSASDERAQTYGPLPNGVCGRNRLEGLRIGASSRTRLRGADLRTDVVAR